MAIREGAKKVSFDASPEELEILKAYCEQTNRNKTEVLREFVRSLKPKLKKITSD